MVVHAKCFAVNSPANISIQSHYIDANPSPEMTHKFMYSLDVSCIFSCRRIYEMVYPVHGWSKCIWCVNQLCCVLLFLCVCVRVKILHIDNKWEISCFRLSWKLMWVWVMMNKANRSTDFYAGRFWAFSWRLQEAESSWLRMVVTFIQLLHFQWPWPT